VTRPAHDFARLAALVAAALAVAGCGSGAPKLVPVRGKVTLRSGTPVHNGSVTFHPDVAKGNKSKELPIGAIDSHGNFTIMTGAREGAPPGWYKVAISAAEQLDPNNPYFTDWLIHERYINPETSKLTAEVIDNPAPGRYDFQVEPHPKAKKK
jgi:hypothetical protein